ncbi:bifunctional glycosyltransferase family 2 protein/CDP-glycerol:glycerophosphate glycerophosphotransferase [Brevibacterium sp. 50QC2O2]|uniref:bifunctional glycosyltransferase/CDP-glycerol:glycerophosphate glycerophosphotransferase n=1 Tax=Brevibacterium sp. 50QC2O2 TaxID=2968459 RepID=UPI00211CB5CA|nr:bifunctional glycosyltransferase family 2 protein/CDP-glycerol:glycerophosphate glycerophosphotransferase [Brevibacterium sp. 50QC2O2]MCQ9388625.1 bifunctional glycosyltransferase family 2 protein/CDP-glycerol:glycerophosphate glycerophosphotransferase [Brevibacterium sp. 50QC2O2]
MKKGKPNNMNKGNRWDRTILGSVSVVIPTYNVEEYISEALDSLVNQSIFTDLNIFVVDDGSTDSSAAIVTKYVRAYDNMHLLRGNHSGPGAARNLALKVARDEFITFMDSDDVIPPTAYELMRNKLQSDPNLEFVTGKMTTFPKEQAFFWQTAYDHGERTVSSILEAPELIHSGSACNKMFRRSVLAERGEHFPETAHFEDARVVIPFLLQSKRFAIVPDTVYLYRKREHGGSIMDSLFSRKQNYWDYLTLIEEVSALSLTLPHLVKRTAEMFCVRGFQGFLLRQADILTSPESIAFLRRSYIVFENVPAWLIRRNTHNPRHANPYGLLRAMGRRNEFSGLSADTRIHFVDGKPQLGMLRMGDYDSLMRSSGFSAWAESIRRDGRFIVVEGRITGRGLPISEKPAVGLSLLLGNRSFAAEWVQRADRPPLAGAWSAFQARIPVSKWPRGEYFPKLRFSEGTGHFKTRLVKTLGLFRNSRTFRSSGYLYEIRSNHKNQVGITKYAVPSNFRHRIRHLISRWNTDRKDDLTFANLVALRAIFKPLIRKRIWLLGERWDMAQDNSASLFKYLSRSSGSDIQAFYVVDKESAAYCRMKKYGRVIPHGSLRHKVYLCIAEAMVSAFDTDTYLKPRGWQKSHFVEYFIGRTDIRRVFLQHGVTFRGDGITGLHRMASGYDLVVSAAPSEAEYFSNTLGYSDRAVPVGFPRFDSLSHVSSEGRRKILFAPTWRADLVVPSYSESANSSDAEAFRESHYYKSIMDFLNSPSLHNSLEKNDCDLYFLPHYEVKELFRLETNKLDRVKIASTDEADFQMWLRIADVFITDYSSTSFDVAFMGTPVIYFGWDPVDKTTGEFFVYSYFHYQSDGFGPVALSPDDVVAYIDLIADNGFQMDAMYKTRVHSFFSLPDGKTYGAAVAEAIRSIGR